MPTEMQRYKVDFHKLIYGAVKPAEGKKNSMRSKSFFHRVYRTVVEIHRMKSK